MSDAPLSFLQRYCNPTRHGLIEPFAIDLNGKPVVAACDGMMAMLVVGACDVEQADQRIANGLRQIAAELGKATAQVVALRALQAWAGDDDREQTSICRDCNGTAKIKCKECSGTGRRKCETCSGSRRHSCDCGDSHPCGDCNPLGEVACGECEDGKQECDCGDGKVEPPLRLGRILGRLIDRSRLAALLAHVSGDEVLIAEADAVGVFGDNWTAILMRMRDDGEKCPTWGDQ